jgi:Spy/CpxP family protein refolding chaperone
MKLLTGMLLSTLAIAGLASNVYAAPGIGPGPFPGGPGNPALMLEHMADHLDLTDQQRDSVENILQAAKPEIEAIRDQAKANHEAIQALDPASPAYDVELNNIAVSNGELAAAGTLLAVRIRSEVHAVLTDEQIAKLERGKERMKKRLRNRFGND